MAATVDFGGEHLAIPIDGARLVGEWRGPEGRKFDEMAGEFRRRLDAPLQFPALRQAVVPGDRVVIAVEPGLPEIRTVLDVVCEVLADAGVHRGDVTIVATLKPEMGWDAVLPAGVVGVAHDPDDRTQLAYLATTEAGRRVYLNRLATDADFLLAIGQVRDDRMLGPLGPWTTLFPGLSDSETLQAFRAGASDRKSSDLAIKESAEVSWLIGNQFQVGIVPGGSGIHAMIAGLAEAVREESIRQNARAWSFHAPERADLVIAGVGGPGQVAGIGELAEAFGSAAGVVRRGGKVVVLSRAKGEIGPALQRLMGRDDDRSAVASLKGAESEADYPEALEIAKALAWADLYLLSDLGEQAAEDLGFIPLTQPEEAVRLAKASPSVILLSHADRTRTSTAEDDE